MDTDLWMAVLVMRMPTRRVCGDHTKAMRRRELKSKIGKRQKIIIFILLKILPYIKIYIGYVKYLDIFYFK